MPNKITDAVFRVIGLRCWWQGAEVAAKLSTFEHLSEPTMGGEDFSFIAEQVR